MILAADMNVQIFTIDKEVSGVSNLTFALSGALTILTRNETSIEIMANVI